MGASVSFRPLELPGSVDRAREQIGTYAQFFEEAKQDNGAEWAGQTRGKLDAAGQAEFDELLSHESELDADYFNIMNAFGAEMKSRGVPDEKLYASAYNTGIGLGVQNVPASHVRMAIIASVLGLLSRGSDELDKVANEIRHFHDPVPVTTTEQAYARMKQDSSNACLSDEALMHKAEAAAMDDRARYGFDQTYDNALWRGVANQSEAMRETVPDEQRLGMMVVNGYRTYREVISAK